jgi:uncharacterized protein
MTNFDSWTDPFEGVPGCCSEREARQALIAEVRRQFALDWGGIHGAGHWARVWHNGQRIGESLGADLGVVELFAWLHDSCRLDDARDPDHGPRAAEWAATLRGCFFVLDDARFELLVTACELHTFGGTVAPPTVMACWDADRLDLGRVGIRPHPQYLCSDLAKQSDTIEWAYRRSLERD